MAFYGEAEVHSLKNFAIYNTCSHWGSSEPPHSAVDSVSGAKPGGSGLSPGGSIKFFVKHICTSFKGLRNIDFNYLPGTTAILLGFTEGILYFVYIFALFAVSVEIRLGITAEKGAEI